MGLFGNNVVAFKGQNYDQLRKTAQSSGTLFEDPEFLAADSSLFHKRTSPGRIEWKRPGELCSNPHLVVDGTKSGDVTQGQLGNCWFVAATANLAQEKELWEKVVPNAKDQDWDEENKEKYAGIFHFRFWRFGKWQDVVIDDRLPCNNNKLIYTHSEEGNEFWSALLEKAYAKISGCYENLDGGNTADALVDFTGGVAEQINLQEESFVGNLEKHKELHAHMKKYSERRFLMSASIKVTSAEEMEARTDVGLVKGHAYGVTAVKTVKLGESGLLNLFNKEKVYLVRLRNPWGEKEWTGPWSDGSPEWQKVSESQRKSLGIVNEDDGEFWMPFEEFCSHFTTLVICRMPNQAFFSLHRTWHETLLLSQWKFNSNAVQNRAGGCINNKDTFLQNPQFLLSVDTEKDDIIVSLSQPDTRADQNEQAKTIGFYVMEVESNRKYRAHSIKQKAFMSTYINSRSVFAKQTLLRGRYIIVPTIFEAKIESPLMLRVFSDTGAGVKELKEDYPSPGAMECCRGGNIQVVSQVTVLGATNLPKQDHFGGGADPYVYIKCEGKTAKSRVQENTLNPEFKYNAIFYRRKAQQPIVIEVWNHNVVKDTFMGQAIFMAQNKGQPENNVAVLKKRGRDSEDAAGGNISVVITTTDDLRAL
ncbi:calpain-5-like [Diadema antillarum]|uniref:calpain-5-like n=1 Tax=Diadema antillarum TaxID=105358 RepID=UPI003A8368C8